MLTKTNIHVVHWEDTYQVALSSFPNGAPSPNIATYITYFHYWTISNKGFLYQSLEWNQLVVIERVLMVCIHRVVNSTESLVARICKSTTSPMSMPFTYFIRVLEGTILGISDLSLFDTFFSSCHQFWYYHSHCVCLYTFFSLWVYFHITLVYFVFGLVGLILIL